MAVEAEGKRGPRRQHVLETLRSSIVGGELEPGERLIEERISQELQTSRGPVREALRQLEHEGLVRSEPYRGAVVVGVSEEEVREVLMPVRLIIERYSFPKAAAEMTDADFAELGKAVWVMEDAARTGDLRRIVEADLGFHEIVLTYSGQPHALQIWRSIVPRIRSYFLQYGKLRDLDVIVGEHRDLLAAVQTRDSDVLLPVLEEHILIENPEAVAT